MDSGIGKCVAVVTGGDSGMGFATGELLLREGVRVVLTNKEDATLQEAAGKLQLLGEVFAFAADLTQPAHVEALRAAATDRFGPSGILVNAAGITGPTAPFHTLSGADWMQALEID